MKITEQVRNNTVNFILDKKYGINMKTIMDLVKDNTANFVYFRDGKMVYDIVDTLGRKMARFDIDVTNKEEIGNAAFEASHKAITLMRYIRKAITDETIFIYE